MSWAEAIPVVVAAVGSGGLVALLTVRQQRRTMAATASDLDASANQRIMAGAATIVEQAATQTPALMERITRLEASNERILDEQASERAELTTALIELQAWRQWGAVLMPWAAQAVDAIRSLGGTIADPPQPPAVERRQNTAA